MYSMELPYILILLLGDKILMLVSSKNYGVKHSKLKYKNHNKC